MDPIAAAGVRAGPRPVSWDADAVILYHLGLGAGDPPTDPAELSYVDETRLRVLPTFATVPAGAASTELLGHRALAHRPEQLLHVAQELVVHRPVPARAQGSARASVESVADRGSAAQVVVAVELEADATPIATTRFHLWLHGEGGFGGPRPARVGGGPPGRPADAEVQVRTLPQLAAIFRLSADRHRVHIDPAVAAGLGYRAPLLAGLCTWGVVAKAVVAAVGGGDPGALSTYSARFDGPVHPGETLRIRSWYDDGAVEVVATVAERGAPALTGRLTFDR